MKKSKDLAEALIEMLEENMKLQMRIDKAIEFLHNNTMIGHCKEYYELLEILGDKENGRND